MTTIRYTGKTERVILGQFMYPKETRDVPESLAKQLAKDNKDIEIVSAGKAKKKPAGKKDAAQPELPPADNQSDSQG